MCGLFNIHVFRSKHCDVIEDFFKGIRSFFLSVFQKNITSATNLSFFFRRFDIERNVQISPGIISYSTHHDTDCFGITSNKLFFSFLHFKLIKYQMHHFFFYIF